MRYLGVQFVNHGGFRYAAKRGFQHAANSIFGKLERVASKVVIQLISSKCMPILLYGLEACAINKSDISHWPLY